MTIPLLVSAPTTQCEALVARPDLSVHQCVNDATVPEHMTVDADGPLIVPAMCDKHTAMTVYLGIFE